MIPLFLWILSPHFPIQGPNGEQELIASILFVLASITDGLDGYLARKRGQITTMGMLLDPLITGVARVMDGTGAACAPAAAKAALVAAVTTAGVIGVGVGIDLVQGDHDHHATRAALYGSAAAMALMGTAFVAKGVDARAGVRALESLAPTPERTAYLEQLVRPAARAWFEAGATLGGGALAVGGLTAWRWGS